MKIKNTAELRRRANAHARNDRIAQGTYGDASVNGHVEYHGCAIGCLSTPHRKAELRTYLLSQGADILDIPRPNVEAMLRRLSREFGISPALARCAEAIFETLPTHGAAIEFIPKFAASLNEGADITPAALRNVWPDIIDTHGGWSYVTSDRAKWPRSERAAVAAEQFLRWLRAQRP